MGIVGKIISILALSLCIAAPLLSVGCASTPERRAAMSDEARMQIVMDAVMDQIYEDIYRNQIEWLQRELQEKDSEEECIRKCDKAAEEGCAILCQGVPDEAKCYSECIGNGFRDCLRKCRGRR